MSPRRAPYAAVFACVAQQVEAAKTGPVTLEVASCARPAPLLNIVFAKPQNANVHQRKHNAHESMHMHMACAKLGTHIAA